MAKSKRKRSEGKGALEIAEEAVHLLRLAPARVLACYYFGALPFVLGLLYFWADMSKSAFAYRYLHSGTLVLALLFVWMKTWQAVYARLLWAEVSSEAVPRWGIRRMLRIAVMQTILQPSGLLALPVALLFTVPFGYSYAFYQNITVLDDGAGTGVRDFVRKAAALARPWPKQNHLLIWALSPFLTILAAGLFLVIIPVTAAIGPDWTGFFLGIYSVLFTLALMPLSPFGVVIAANIAMGILLVPGLLNMLLGVNTVFLENWNAMLNSTFFAVVIGLTYLCMDPLMKAAYVLRCFYAKSIRSGEDLKVELRRLAQKAAMATVLCVICLGALASDASAAGKTLPPATAERQTNVSPAELDTALDRELKARRYAWRMPRESLDVTPGPLGNFMEAIRDTIIEWLRTVRRWLRKLGDWLDKLFPDRAPTRAPDFSGVGTVLRFVLYVLLGAILLVAGVMLYRMWERRGKQSREVVAEAAEPAVDIEDESTTADGLPEEGWLKLAHELLDKGELRLAVRAMFLATLSLLAERELVNIARFKSNLDYRRELGLRAHARPEILETFSGSVTMYESVWYGLHEARRELFQRIAANQERLRERANEQ
jgi:hypothetical protein